MTHTAGARFAARVALLLVSLGLAVLLCELALRVSSPGGGFGAAEELPWLRGADRTQLFVLDPDFGFRPALGNELFDAYGTHRNEYEVGERAGRERVLFLGDSVTARGHIVEALRERYGEAGFEYWNAGVDSFNTVQEVAFYRQFNAAIRPDHVVLTFHLNDLETTPVAFRDERGDLMVYALNQPARQVNRWWFEHSHLYRLWLGSVQDTAGRFDTLAREAEGALSSLQAQLTEDEIRLTVIVLPLFEQPARWSAGHKRARRRILAFLKRQGIAHVDLLPALQRALGDGVGVQEVPGDTFHPSRGVARVFAEVLQEAGLLGASSDARGVAP
jgi:lysophospholipase L1-like esterase